MLSCLIKIKKYQLKSYLRTNLNFMLKAVLFDMDGVIVDTEPLHQRAYMHMFDKVGIRVSKEQYNRFTGQSTLAICKQLCNHYKLRQHADELVKIKRDNFTKLFFEDNTLELINGVETLIKEYHQHGLALVLASSASMFTIKNITKRFNLDRFFLNKLSGADLRASKPHPEIFLKAAKAAQVLPSECLVIEDSTNGIMAANRAGIFCVAYKNENSVNQDYKLADKLISDYSEISYEKVKNLV